MCPRIPKPITYLEYLSKRSEPGISRTQAQNLRTLRLSAAAIYGIDIEEYTLCSKSMILPVTLEEPRKRLDLPTYALLDTGAEGYGFVDQGWVQDQKLELLPLKEPIGLVTFDGREQECGKMTHYVQMDMRIQDHFEKNAKFYVVQLAHYPVVLGVAWMKIHDPLIRFAAHNIAFDSDYCRKHCNTPQRPAKIPILHDIPPKSQP
jgi:hypothetical protein